MAITPTYGFNGSAASLHPVSVQWQQIKVGTDHNGAPLYSANHTITMQFPPGSITHARQWLVQASGGTSINLYVLDKWQIGTTILSNVFLEVMTPPSIQSINASEFTLAVHGATASAIEMEH
jgi:hypothetical protein